MPSQQTSKEGLVLDREVAGQTMALVKPNFLHSMARVLSDREQMVTTYPARVPSAMVSGDVAMLAIVSRGDERELAGPEGVISTHKSQDRDSSYWCETTQHQRGNAWKDFSGGGGLTRVQIYLL